MKHFIKPILWTFLTVFFGLLQLWSVIFISFLIDRPIEINYILRNCGLLFFSTSLIISITLNFIFKRKTTKNLPIVSLVYFTLPIFCVFFSILIYYASYFNEPNIGKIAWFQIIIFIITLIYVMTIKYYQYKKL